MSADVLSVDLSGQVAVITGAGRGFGLAFAQALCEHGATSILVEVDREAGEQAAAGLAGRGLAAHFMPCDVSDAAQVEQVAQAVYAAHGRLDLWINNAGLARHQPSETLPVPVWQLGLGVMLSGTFYGCQSAGRLMIEQGHGKIINIASVNGFLAQPGRAAYNAAKAGIIHLTATLGCEWAPYGVQVNAVAPNVFMTDLARAAVNDGAASFATYIRRSPARRLGEMPELVATILFLAGEHSGYIIGQTLRVDGAIVSDHYL